MGSDDVFDRPAQWRLEAIRHLGLTGEARVAGAVTGAGYPQALDPIVAALRSCRCVCDVGAGLGGASAWLAANAGLEVIAVEPEWASARAARDLFPALPVVVGAADSLPLRDGTCDAAVCSLVLCSVADLRASSVSARSAPPRCRAAPDLLDDPWSVGCETLRWRPCVG